MYDTIAMFGLLDHNAHESQTKGGVEVGSLTADRQNSDLAQLCGRSPEHWKDPLHPDLEARRLPGLVSRFRGACVDMVGQSSIQQHPSSREAEPR